MEMVHNFELAPNRCVCGCGFWLLSTFCNGSFSYGISVFAVSISIVTWRVRVGKALLGGIVSYKLSMMFESGGTKKMFSGLNHVKRPLNRVRSSLATSLILTWMGICILDTLSHFQSWNSLLLIIGWEVPMCYVRLLSIAPACP